MVELVHGKSPHEFIDFPDEWEVRQVRTILEKIDNRTEKEDARLLSVSKYDGIQPREDIVNNREFRADTTEGYKIVQPGDLVVNIMLAWDGALGISPAAGVVSPSYEVYRLTADANPDFINYLLRSRLYQYEFSRHSTGIIPSRWRLYKPQFFSIKIPFPPVEDQRDISNYLEYHISRINTLIEQKESLIELVNEKRRAIITQAVTKGLDPEVNLDQSKRDGIWQSSGDWATAPVFSIAKRQNTTIDPQSMDVEEVFHYSLVNYQEIGDGKLEDPNDIESKKILLSGDEIIVSKLNPRKGQVIVVEENQAPIICSTEFVVLKPKTENVKRGWLYLLFSSEPVRQYLEGTSQSATHSHMRVSPYDILHLDCPVPPINEQQKVLNRVGNYEAEATKLSNELEKSIQILKEERRARTIAAITGQIDLSDWERPEEQEVKT